MKLKNSIILLRGLPGSGKSTLAELLSENGKYPIFSIDDFFTDKNTSEYIFDFKNNHLAYKLCEENTKLSMELKVEKIFIHNTFTLEWELEAYFKLAKLFDYTIHVATIENYHFNKNIHSITDDQMEKMAKKYKVKLI